MDPITIGAGAAAAVTVGTKVFGSLFGGDDKKAEAAMEQAILVQGMLVAMPILNMTRESLMQE